MKYVCPPRFLSLPSMQLAPGFHCVTLVIHYPCVSGSQSAQLTAPPLFIPMYPLNSIHSFICFFTHYLC